MARFEMRKTTGRYRAVVYAVLVHLLVVAVLMISFTWQSDENPAPPVMQAKVVEDPNTRKEIERLKEQEEQRRLEEQQRLETQKQQEEQQRQEEVRRQDEQQRQEEERRQQQLREQAKEQERQRQEEVKRKAAEAEKQRKAEEERKRQAAEAEKKRQAELQRKQEDQRRRQEAEDALKQQLAAEEAERQQARDAATLAQNQREIARIEALIRQKVERAWVKPTAAQQGLECIVRVRLVPSGEVLQAAVIRGSGNPAFDRSVEVAVYKASPLPMPEDKALFDHFRELEFKFRPEG